LLLLAGGDGTARDVLASADGPVLGIPAGVKVYSGCFAISPFAAGTTAAAFTGATVEAEVVDLDEEEYRAGRVGARLHGTVRVPAVPRRLSGRKTGSSHTDPATVESIARAAATRMVPEVSYLLGPGGTTQAVGRLLGLETSPLGIDLVRDGRLIARDLSEPEIYDWIMYNITYAILSVLGGQGFVIGRGNQQLSPRVLARLSGLEILATREKLAALHGRPLLADSGDPAADRALSGHVRVVTGHRETTLYRLSSASEEA
ncbi:ATP-NAD kinase family protein, partial [Actinocorallia lasiicapitis]